MPTCRMFLARDRRCTGMPSRTDPLGSLPGPGGRPHEPAHRRRHELVERQRCFGGGREPAQRRVVYQLVLLRCGGATEREHGRRDAHRAVERRVVDGGARRQRDPERERHVGQCVLRRSRVLPRPSAATGRVWRRRGMAPVGARVTVPPPSNVTGAFARSSTRFPAFRRASVRSSGRVTT